MRTIEIRRHSHRKAGGGSQLSQEGVAYARALGDKIGPFAYVAASVAPRARETAVAMGFAVDQDIVTLCSEEDVFHEMGISRWWDAPRSLVALAEVMRARGPSWRYGCALASLLRDLITPQPDGASMLVVTHSGELELALIGCFPDADHAAWGSGFAPCEGARLFFDGEPARFVRIELLRGGA